MTNWTPSQLLEATGTVVQTFIAPILAYAAYVLRDVRQELRTLNGRLIKVETWKDMHDHADERLHGELDARLEHLERRRTRP